MSFLKYQGFPEEDETVICRVKNIYRNAVFVEVLFYDKGGMINISEIAPGRIRNIRDYVTDGKIIVCKVLSVDREKNHINLSLRRITEKEKKEKLNDMKQEQKAEKLMEMIASKKKIDALAFYKTIAPKILKEYDALFECFNDVVSGETSLKELGIEPKTAEELEKIIKEKIIPPEVSIKGQINLKNFEEDGVEKTRQVIKELISLSEKISISYKAGGHYKIEVFASNYKDAEKIISKINDKIESLKHDKNFEVEFLREKKA